mgnify:CR=1 FL=1|jgi:hypothetical protein
MTGMKQKLLGACSVGYSGGMDSTAVAYMAAMQKKGCVHLHTLDHGFGYLFNAWAKRPFKTLRKALGDDAVVHRYVKTNDLFRELAANSFIKDKKEYGQTFGCCLGCTMALVTKMVIYNLERGIPHIFFGSSVGGEYAVMSMEATVTRLQKLCAKYGVIYAPPLLENHIEKAAERKLLDDAGVFRGYRFLDKHSFGNQGYCLLSLQHLPDVLFNVHPTYDSEQVGRFFDDKAEICERYIETYFKAEGKDLDAAVAALLTITRDALESQEP